MGHLMLNIIIVFIIKKYFSKQFNEKFNFLDKIIHCIENTNIPYNAQEWDDGKGNALEHIKRMKANLVEVMVVILIKFIFNSMLLLPICYLGKQSLNTCTYLILIGYS